MLMGMLKSLLNMETLEGFSFYRLVEQYIHLPYLVLFVLFTYSLKDLVVSIVSGLVSLFTKTPKLLPAKYAVFVFATILAVPFWFYTDPIRLFITYAVGTSFYELIIEALEGVIKKWLKKLSS